MSWIKVRDDIHADPAVDFIASRCSVTALHVVGALAAAWSWAGRLSDDGKVPLATPALLDKITQTPGLAAAMKEAGWLEVGDTYLVFPKWDRHNEAGAKARALASERQRKKRVTVERDGPVTVERDQRRGEERREEDPPVQPPAGAGTPPPPAVPAPAERRKKRVWKGTIPDALSGNSFAAAWDRWLKHRVEIQKPVTQSSGDQSLAELASWGIPRALAAIDHTIARGWKNLVEPTGDDLRSFGRPGRPALSLSRARGHEAWKADAGCRACGHVSAPTAIVCASCGRPLHAATSETSLNGTR